MYKRLFLLFLIGALAGGGLTYFFPHKTVYEFADEPRMPITIPPAITRYTTFREGAAADVQFDCRMTDYVVNIDYRGFPFTTRKSKGNHPCMSSTAYGIVYPLGLVGNGLLFGLAATAGCYINRRLRGKNEKN